VIPSVPISFAAGGDSTIVAAKPGLKIRVVNFMLVAAGAVVAKFKGTGGADLTGPMTMATGGQITPSFAGMELSGLSGHFETPVGEGLVLNTSGAVQVSGWVNYVVVAH